MKANQALTFNLVLIILVLLGAWYVIATIDNVTLDSPASGTNVTNASGTTTFSCSAFPRSDSGGVGNVTNISLGFNFTAAGTPNGSIVLNVSQHLANGTNTSNIVFNTSTLAEGRYLWSCLGANASALTVIVSRSFNEIQSSNNGSARNGSAKAADSNNTIIVDGSGPYNITLVFPYNASGRNLTNAHFTNGTVTVAWSVQDTFQTRSVCNVTVNDVVRATNVEGNSTGRSSGLAMVNVSNFTAASVRGFTALITNNSWYVACTDNVGNANISGVNRTANVTLFAIEDTVRPYEVGPLKFKGTLDGRADTEAVKFDFGSKVTITGCNGTENVDYFNSNATIDIKRPGSTGFSRVKNATSGIASFVFDDTSDLGTYEVNCTYIDGSGNGNSSVKKFEILSTRIRGSGAAAIPGFKFSKGTTLIGSETRNDAGSLTPTDSSWLFRSGGTIVFQVAGARHSFQVKEIKEKSVVVTVSSTPFDVEVNEGETKNVDVDGDGSADVAITLNGFTPSRHADLTFKAVGGIPAEAGPGVSEEKAPTAGPITSGVGNGTWLIVGIIVVVLIVGYFLIKRR